MRVDHPVRMLIIFAVNLHASVRGVFPPAIKHKQKQEMKTTRKLDTRNYDMWLVYEPLIQDGRWKRVAGFGDAIEWVPTCSALLYYVQWFAYYDVTTQGGCIHQMERMLRGYGSSVIKELKDELQSMMDAACLPFEPVAIWWCSATALQIILDRALSIAESGELLFPLDAERQRLLCWRSAPHIFMAAREGSLSEGGDLFGE